MATLRGIDGIVMIGSDAVLEVQNWSMSRTAEETNTSIINSTAKRTETGAIESSGSVSCYLNADDTTGQEAFESAFNNNTAVTLNLYPTKNESGGFYYSVSAAITSIEIDNGGANGRVTRNFSWKGISAVTVQNVA